MKKLKSQIISLKNCRKNNIEERIDAEILYTERYPENKRKDYELILNKLGVEKLIIKNK